MWTKWNRLHCIITARLSWSTVVTTISPKQYLQLFYDHHYWHLYFFIFSDYYDLHIHPTQPQSCGRSNLSRWRCNRNHFQIWRQNNQGICFVLHSRQLSLLRSKPSLSQMSSSCSSLQLSTSRSSDMIFSTKAGERRLIVWRVVTPRLCSSLFSSSCPCIIISFQPFWKRIEWIPRSSLFVLHPQWSTTWRLNRRWSSPLPAFCQTLSHYPDELGSLVHAKKWWRKHCVVEGA